MRGGQRSRRPHLGVHHLLLGKSESSRSLTGGEGKGRMSQKTSFLVENRKGCEEKESTLVEQTFEGFISPFLSMSWTVYKVSPGFTVSWTQE